MICQEEDRYGDRDAHYETMSSASSSDMESDVHVVNHSDTFSMNSVNSIEDLVIDLSSVATHAVRLVWAGC